jgi:hypothetical protein
VRRQVADALASYTIKIDIFCSFCKIKRIDRIRYCINFINKILQSILLLFRKVDVLLKDVKHSNKQ